jgi:hypothetical protein
MGLLGGLAGAFLASAAVAGAAEPGVIIDPEAPAAKEYALPLDAARQAAGGGGAAGGTRAGATPKPVLFGEGVSRDARSGSGKRRTSSNARTSSGKVTGEAVRTIDEPTPQSARLAQRAQVAEGGIGGTGAVLAGGAGLVLVALLGGFAARAMRAQDQRP